MYQIQRGSQWRRWDLHVHTPASFEHQYKILESERDVYLGENAIWDKYADELEKILDVSVLGVTDYFSIEGYKKILKYRKDNRLKNFDLILPNIEFRLESLIIDGSTQKLNYHVIFSDELSPDIIQRYFLNDLKIKFPNNESRPLSYEAILELGKYVQEKNQEFKGDSEYIAGCKNAYVSLDNIISTLNEKKSIFSGKYLLVLPDRIWENIRWDSQGHTIKSLHLHQSHAVFSSQKSTIDFCLGKKEEPGAFLKAFGKYYPCIHGSDAHKYDLLCKPAEEKNCWIKANPTFEGLKQILYEPEERVNIQKENPDPRKPGYTLSSVKISKGFINSKCSLENNQIPLNKNFIAITGGKGSGKTALIDLIAHCFINRRKSKDNDDKNSFVQRIETETTELTINIEFLDPKLQHITKKIQDNNVCDFSRIEYFPQGKIDQYCGDWESLNRKIEEIIFQSEVIRESHYLLQYKEIEQKILETSESIRQINGNIVQQEEKTSKAILNDIESRLSIKKTELLDKELFLTEIESKIDEKKLISIQELSSKKEKILTQKASIIQLNKQVDDIHSKIIDEVEPIISQISQLNNTLKRFDGYTSITPLDISRQTKDLSQLSEKISLDLITNGQKLEEINNKLEPLLKEQEEHVKILETIHTLKQQLDEIKQEKLKIDNYEQIKKKLEDERELSFKKILGYHKEKTHLFNQISSSFSQGKSDILNDIEFFSSSIFNKEKIREKALDLFNLRKVTEHDIESFITTYDTILMSYFSDNDNLDSIITLIIQFINNKTYSKKGNGVNEFYNWLFGNYVDDKIGISFNNIHLEKLSMGQKATVLLKLFLSEGDYPLLLDQPEENLDNRFIFLQLVKAIKEAKKKRQIIIATNNANLVVNADAEQIISASYVDGVISYKPGAIESMDIRNEILPVLEGGKEAFRLRENKYGNLGIMN
ncbi:TrlF family AAA-like ATPase [Methanospirillum lacunae]|uniref:Rad50/SbcC-type AAA domain-containing protein n=1 Tax=Methanospirillum lacunae TaxID=668570 RepID=A0A2V2N5T7_9EURY|nr:hypothetical protein [Methanospirillum lacunae]PWR73875.1 hypothetical protein DK846_01540 [Methanospirillum lacunae]